MKKTLFLIDGFSYLYRTYYVSKNISYKKNIKVRAIYGLLHLLRKIIIKYKPKKIAIIFDHKKNDFRKKIYKKYKEKRKKMPKDLKKQLPLLYKIIKLLGIPLLIIKYVEADDVIGTIAKKEEKEMKVLILTSDKDFSQLVNKNINILDIYKKKILGAKEIKNKYGVYPNLMIDWLSLVGDISDNIPGVCGIGKKTAVVLLTNIGNIKKIYKNINLIDNLQIRCKKKIISNLIKYKKLAFLSYKLAKIKLNVKIDVNLSLSKPHKKKLEKIFLKINFNNWLIYLKKDVWLNKY
ncbi:5'-3' exonuclease H3TH domain-containing protein [Buchnera aphidicola (Taiwanaphis decaspermi)]|uniref:5'-3' exonuclease n=1 Tax=Buchnera aphidicola TaxID=9 RepID=UPI0031B85088